MDTRYFFSVLLLTSFFFSSCKKDDFSVRDYETQLEEAINNHRQSIGKTTFVHNDFLWKLANEHSENMAKAESGPHHDGIEIRYDLIWDELGKGESAELVALGDKKDPETMVDFWLADVGFKDKLEGWYTYIGLSTVEAANGIWYYTLIFHRI